MSDDDDEPVLPPEMWDRCLAPRFAPGFAWMEPTDLRPYIERLQRDARDLARGQLSWTYTNNSFYEAFTAPPAAPVVMQDGRCLGILTDVRNVGPCEWAADLLPDPFAGDNP